MGRTIRFIMLISGLILCGTSRAYQPPAFPFAPAAGESGSSAVAHDDPRITGWATRVVEVTYGEDVAPEWRAPEAAVGPASAGEPDVLVLGRGGEVVLEFSPFIEDGEGPDFVVFENAFRDTFLELAFVEVSSDGRHWVRFPNYSWTAEPLDDAFGDVEPTYVHGFAGKYRAGYGTPFDLADLAEAYLAIEAGYDGFASVFSQRLREHFPRLDLSRIRYVRLIDIPGDGSAADSEGAPIYDPYPTVITAGFDLDAVGVLNASPFSIEPFPDWARRSGIAVEAAADPDRDNWSNYMEYLMGTNPVAAHSRPSVRPGPQEGFYSYWRNAQAEVVAGLVIGRTPETLSPYTGWVEPGETRMENGSLRVREEIELEVAAGMIWVRFLAPMMP